MQGQDLSQVKQYCLNTITSSLSAHIFAILSSIFEVGKNIIPASRQSPWRTFQESLRDIVDWNQRRIDEITKSAVQLCPTLEKLVATAMMCQASLLAGVRGIDLQVKDLERIATSRFVHDWFIQIAKELVHTPTLFGQSSAEQSMSDRQTVLIVIGKSAETVIDSYVPISIILSKPMRPMAAKVSSKHNQTQLPNKKPQVQLGNLRNIKSMDHYLSDTFDTIQDPSILNLENDDGAEPVDSTTIDDTVEEPMVIEIPVVNTAPLQPTAPIPNQAPVQVALPDPTMSFIYAPSTVGSKATYADVKRMLSQTIQ